MRRALRRHDRDSTLRLRLGLVVLLPFLVLPTACSRGGGPVRGVEAMGGDTTDPSSLGRCGDHISTEAGRGGALALTAAFPARVPTGDDLLRGTVTVTNRGGTRFSGLSSAGADVYVTLSGRIVATPVDREDSGMAVELLPGAGRVIPATGRLAQCAGDGGDAAPGRPLPPGVYEIHAALSLTEGPDGRPFLVAGGPWPLQVT